MSMKVLVVLSLIALAAASPAPAPEPEPTLGVAKGVLGGLGGGLGGKGKGGRGLRIGGHDLGAKLRLLFGGLNGHKHVARSSLNDILNMEISSFNDVCYFLAKIIAALTDAIEASITGLGKLLARVLFALLRLIVCVLGGAKSDNPICRNDINVLIGVEGSGGADLNGIVSLYGLGDSHARLSTIIAIYTRGKGIRVCRGSVRVIFNLALSLINRLQLVINRNGKLTKADMTFCIKKIACLAGSVGNSKQKGLGLQIVRYLMPLCNKYIVQAGYPGIDNYADVELEIDLGNDDRAPWSVPDFDSPNTGVSLSIGGLIGNLFRGLIGVTRLASNLIQDILKIVFRSVDDVFTLLLKIVLGLGGLLDSTIAGLGTHLVRIVAGLLKIILCFVGTGKYGVCRPEWDRQVGVYGNANSIDLVFKLYRLHGSRSRVNRYIEIYTKGRGIESTKGSMRTLLGSCVTLSNMVESRKWNKNIVIIIFRHMTYMLGAVGNSNSKGVGTSVCNKFIPACNKYLTEAGYPGLGDDQEGITKVIEKGNNDDNSWTADIDNDDDKRTGFIDDNNNDNDNDKNKDNNKKDTDRNKDNKDDDDKNDKNKNDDDKNKKNKNDDDKNKNNKDNDNDNDKDKNKGGKDNNNGNTSVTTRDITIRDLFRIIFGTISGVKKFAIDAFNALISIKIRALNDVYDLIINLTLVLRVPLDNIVYGLGLLFTRIMGFIIKTGVCFKGYPGNRSICTPRWNKQFDIAERDTSNVDDLYVLFKLTKCQEELNTYIMKRTNGKGIKSARNPAVRILFEQITTVTTYAKNYKQISKKSMTDIFIVMIKLTASIGNSRQKESGQKIIEELIRQCSVYFKQQGFTDISVEIDVVKKECGETNGDKVDWNNTENENGGGTRPTTPSGSDKGKTTPSGSDKGRTTPSGGDKGKTTPSGTDKGRTTPSGGDKGKTTPSGSDKGRTTPSGGNGKTTPSGGDYETTPASGGNNGKTTPSGSDNETTPASGGDNGKTTPSGSDKGRTTPSGGDKGKTTPSGSDKGRTTPSGGDKGKTTPSGTDKGRTTPSGGDKGKTTPSGSDKGRTTPSRGNGKTTPSGGGYKTTPASGGDNGKTTPSEGGYETTPASGGDNGKTTPSEGGYETTPASGGDNGNTTPSGSDNETTPASGGDNGKTTPSGGESETTPASGGDNGKTTPSGGESETTAPSGGDNGETTPSSGGNDNDCGKDIGNVIQVIPGVTSLSSTIISQIIKIKINTFYDMINLMVKLTLALGGIIDSIISGMGSMFVRMVAVTIKIYYCVNNKGQDSGNICTKEWNTQWAVVGDANTAGDMLALYRVNDCQSAVAKMVSTYTNGKGVPSTSGITRVMLQIITEMSTMVTSTTITKETISSVFVSVINIFGSVTNSYRKGSGTVVIRKVLPVFGVWFVRRGFPDIRQRQKTIYSTVQVGDSDSFDWTVVQAGGKTKSDKLVKNVKQVFKDVKQPEGANKPSSISAVLNLQPPQSFDDVCYFGVQVCQALGSIIDVFINDLGTLIIKVVGCLINYIVAILGASRNSKSFVSQKAYYASFGVKVNGKLSTWAEHSTAFQILDAKTRLNNILNTYTKTKGRESLKGAERVVFDCAFNLVDIASAGESIKESALTDVFYSVTTMLTGFANSLSAGIGEKICDNMLPTCSYYLEQNGYPSLASRSKTIYATISKCSGVYAPWVSSTTTVVEN